MRIVWKRIVGIRACNYNRFPRGLTSCREVLFKLPARFARVRIKAGNFAEAALLRRSTGNSRGRIGMRFPRHCRSHRDRPRRNISVLLAPRNCMGCAHTSCSPGSPSEILLRVLAGSSADVDFDCNGDAIASRLPNWRRGHPTLSLAMCDAPTD